MKKIILAIGLMFGGVAFVNAQQTQQQDTTQTQQSDQYRTDTTSTDDSQNQPQQYPTQADTTSTEQSDMYRTEGEGNVNDSTANDAETTTETESTTDSQSTTGTPTTDDQMSTDQSGVTQDDQEKEGEKIEVSELPAAVQTKLQSTDYQGWVVTSARKKMWSDPDNAQAASKEVYVIEAKNGAETKKLKFDKDGNEIEHDKDKKDDHK